MWVVPQIEMHCNSEISENGYIKYRIHIYCANSVWLRRYTDVQKFMMRSAGYILIRLLQQHAAGLLSWAWRVGDIDGLL